MANYNLVYRTAIFSTIIYCLFVTFAWPAEVDHFRKYRFPSDGFEAAFPQKPLESQIKIDSEHGYINSYKVMVVNPISQYSVFVGHSPKKMFEDAVIDTYLDKFIDGLMAQSDEPILNYSKRTKFLGFPATEYQYSHKIDGVSVVGRGMVFIVDGEHIRLSQLYATNPREAEKAFNKFVGSFRLIPINSAMSKQRFNDDTRNISFAPPNGWQKGTPKFAQIAAIFSNNEGHSITVIDSGTPTYACDNYTREMRATQGEGVQATGRISANGRPVSWLKHSAHNADAGIRMTSIHYCVNTKKGAVIVIGAAPEQTFFRSETIFKNVVNSMVVRK